MDQGRSPSALRSGLWGLLLLLMAGCDGGSSGPTEDGAAPDAEAWRPHVVVYLVDTLRADRLGCYGDDRGASPVLDALARESARFEYALSQAPWTLPSVVSLLTSSHPVSHEVTSVGRKAPAEVQTLAEQLDAAGYATAGFIYNRLGGSDGGLDQGYDHLYEPPDIHTMTDADRERGAATLRPFFDWFERAPLDDPFFFYIHTLEPHWPYEGRWPGSPTLTAEQEEQGKRLNKMVGEHRGLMTKAAVAEREGTPLAPADADKLARLTAHLEGSLENVDALYAGDIRRADGNIGRVIEALKRRGVWDQTVFIVLADHGEEFYDHGNWFHGQSVHDELVRVPLIVRIPGVTDGGHVVTEPVQLVDVAPTVADLLGVAPADHWQGRSLLPLIRDEAGAGGDATAFTMRVNAMRGAANTRDAGEGRETAVRRGRHKAIVNHHERRVKLFDLAADPAERVDLASEHPELAKELGDLVLKWLAATGRRDFPKPFEIEPGQDVLDRLDELGY